jgi:hypothetical protein
MRGRLRPKGAGPRSRASPQANPARRRGGRLKPNTRSARVVQPTSMCGKPHQKRFRTLAHSDRVCRIVFAPRNTRLRRLYGPCHCRHQQREQGVEHFVADFRGEPADSFLVCLLICTETVSNLGVCRPLVRVADRVEHRKSGMIRVAMTYRLCSPPRFETVSQLKFGCFVRSDCIAELRPGMPFRPVNHLVRSPPRRKSCDRRECRGARPGLRLMLRGMI